MPLSMVVASRRLSRCPPSLRAPARGRIASPERESDRMRRGGAHEAHSFDGRWRRPLTVGFTTGAENSAGGTGKDPRRTPLEAALVLGARPTPVAGHAQCWSMLFSASPQVQPAGELSARVDNRRDAGYQDVLDWQRRAARPAPCVTLGRPGWRRWGLGQAAKQCEETSNRA
jgi:hypothetical protein